jgi:hypothetical protein
MLLHNSQEGPPLVQKQSPTVEIAMLGGDICAFKGPRTPAMSPPLQGLNALNPTVPRPTKMANRPMFARTALFGQDTCKGIQSPDNGMRVDKCELIHALPIAAPQGWQQHA